MLDTLEEFAVWTTAYMNDLPDSAFLYVEAGGSKDQDGKTVPRTLRHFPYKNADGQIDLPHLRNALARIPQSNLPADVKKRLTAKAQRILADQNGEQHSSSNFELFSVVAPLTHVEVRDPSANPDNTWTFSGYAAVFNQQAVIRSTQQLEVRYEIDQMAFDNVLATQPFGQPDGVVHFNLNHDMNRVVAATDVTGGQPGSLQLSADGHGLHYLAKVSKDDPDAVALAVKMRDRVIKQASVAFVCGLDDITMTENSDGPHVALRRILEAKRLVDVCATPQGVFSGASSRLQQFAAAFGQPDTTVLGGRPRQPEDFGGASSVIPDESGGVASRRKPRLTATEMRAIRTHLGHSC